MTEFNPIQLPDYLFAATVQIPIADDEQLKPFEAVMEEFQKSRSDFLYVDYFGSNPDTVQFPRIYCTEDSYQAVRDALKIVGLEGKLGPLNVGYRETLAQEVTTSAQFKRQTSSADQYAFVTLRLTPIPPENFVRFRNSLTEESVDEDFRDEFVQGVYDGVGLEVIRSGKWGYPVIGLEIALTEIKTHPVDSSRIAFRVASFMAVNKAVAENPTVLLEPVVRLDIQIPTIYLSAVMNDLQERGLSPDSQSLSETECAVSVNARLSSVVDYLERLSQLTAGKEKHTFTRTDYEPVTDSSYPQMP
jgi:elongation factor G